MVIPRNGNFVKGSSRFIKTDGEFRQLSADGMTEGRWQVPLSDVATDEELVRAAADTVESGWWSMGPRVAEFEQAFGELTGSKHALAVANGTAALHLGLLAVECGPDD